MGNKEQTFRQQFIKENWQHMTDKELFICLLETDYPAPSEVAVTRMRQRAGLNRPKEQIYKLRGQHDN